MQAEPNGAETVLAEAVRRLGRPGFEGALADWFERSVAPDNLIILAYRDGAPPLVLYQRSGVSPVFQQVQSTYLAGAYLLDPYHDLHLTRVPAGLYRLTDVAPDAFQRSRYFTEYYRQTTLLDELAFIAYPAPGVSLNLCLGRDAVSGRAFDARAVETCQRIAPVVVALAETHWAALRAGTTPVGAVSGQLIRALAANGIKVTERQAEVALLILQGHSTASIALRIGVAPQTVKAFRKQLYARCAISSQAELFSLFLPLLREAKL